MSVLSLPRGYLSPVEGHSVLCHTVCGSMQLVPGDVPQKYRDVLRDDWVRGQSGIRERFAEAIMRSGRYLHVIEDIFVREEGLPVELTRLPFIESSFDYTA